jgi:hypothetical protein
MEAVLGAKWGSRDRRTQPARKRRSLCISLAAGVLATVALAVFLAWSALGFFGGVDHLARAPLPSAVSVSASHPGEMVVYYEGHVAPSLDELGLRVREANGAPVALKPYDLDLHYDVGSRVGTAVASFVAPAAGRYLVSASAVEPGARLAVGGDLGRGVVLTDLAGIGVGLAALAAIAAVVGLVLRRSGASRAEYRDAVTRPGTPAGQLSRRTSIESPRGRKERSWLVSLRQ